MSDEDSTDGSAPETAPDGRRAWRDRNRLAVVDAMLDLYSEGNLRPGAQEVAERSGVSRRSVFRYFDDLEDLYRTATHRMQTRVRHLTEVPSLGEGTLAERIATLAGQRVTLFTAVRPAAQVSRLRAPFHTIVHDELQQSRVFLARQVDRQFRKELDAMDPVVRKETLFAADALCSFEAIDFLLSRGLSAGDVQATLERALAGLFCGKPG